MWWLTNKRPEGGKRVLTGTVRLATPASTSVVASPVVVPADGGQAGAAVISGIVNVSRLAKTTVTGATVVATGACKSTSVVASPVVVPADGGQAGAAVISGIVNVSRLAKTTVTGATVVATGAWKSTDWEEGWDWMAKRPIAGNVTRSVLAGTVVAPEDAAGSRRSVLAEPVVVGRPWYADAWALTSAAFRGELLVFKKMYDELKRMGVEANNLAAAPQVHNHSTYTGHLLVDPSSGETSAVSGPVAAYPGSEFGSAATIVGSALVPGGAADEPCRGLYIYDSFNVRVLYFRGDRWVELPEIPGRAGLKTNWTTQTLSTDRSYWAMGSVLFPYQGKLALALYKRLPAPAGLVIFEYDFATGSWADTTQTFAMEGSFDDALGYTFVPSTTFVHPPFSSGEFTPIAQGDTLWLENGQSVFIQYFGAGTTDPIVTLDFVSDSAAGFQGIGVVAGDPYANPTATRFHRIHGNAAAPAGVTSAPFAYTTPGVWQTLETTCAGLEPSGGTVTSMWLVLSAIGIGDGHKVGIRNVRIRQGEALSVYFSRPVNYRGSVVFTGYTTKSSAMFAFSISDDRRIRVGAFNGLQRQPRKEGQAYSYSQHNTLVGHFIPHLDRLYHVVEYTGNRNRWSPPGASAYTEAPMMYDWRFHADPNQLAFSGRLSDTTVAKLSANDTGTLFAATLRDRHVFGLPFRFLGGVSHKGFMWHVNVLGQVVRIDERHRVPVVMYDMPYSFSELDGGITTTDADGQSTASGYAFYLTRPDGPLPYDLPEALRGWGRLGVEFWDAFARLEIVSIPATGDTARDARLATMVGRRGLHSGNRYFEDEFDGSKQYWATTEDGRQLFSSSLSEDGTWIRESLPAGTEIRSRYSFVGSFVSFANGDNPTTLKMFEYDGDLFVLWTFSFNRAAGPASNSAWPSGGSNAPVALTGAKVPPSMLARFHYDPATDTLMLVDKVQLMERGAALELVSAVIEVDDRAGVAWIAYMGAGYPEQEAKLMSVQLSSMGVRYYGPIFATNRYISAGLPFDTRNRIYNSGVLSYNFNEPQAFITRVESDAETGDVRVHYKLFSPDSRTLNIRVRVAYNPTALGSTEPARAFAVATEGDGSDGTRGLASAPGAGASHVFVHRIAADIEAPVVGYLQYEILPFDREDPIDACADVEVDLWVQGIVSGCDQDGSSITVDGLGVSNVLLTSIGTCHACSTSGAQTAGAVKVRSGPLTDLRSAVLAVRAVPTAGLPPECVFTNPINGATMWLTPRGADNTVVLCEASALPGEQVTFTGCTA